MPTPIQTAPNNGVTALFASMSQSPAISISVMQAPATAKQIGEMTLANMEKGGITHTPLEEKDGLQHSILSGKGKGSIWFGENNGIVSVTIITGDNIDTARAIADDCGILTKRNDIVLSATDLDSHTDEWLSRHLSRIKVIARATPATKLRVISVAQAQNKSIGMCGDGTNDAPALRRADVGFAMGAGTDVAKEAGDIIITDNNFVFVANSVLIGRTFLHNVVSFLRFQLPINFSLVALCIAFPLLIGGEVLTAVQILIINIVMDSLNSLAFGGEAPRPEYMRTPTPAKGAPLLPRKSIIQIAVSTFIFLGLFAVMFWGPVRGLFAGAEYTGACFALLVIMAIFNGFNIRADGYNLLAGLRENPMFIFVALGVIGGCVMCVTFGGAALQVAPLNMVQWAVVFCLAVMVVPLDMMRKFVMRRMA